MTAPVTAFAPLDPAAREALVALARAAALARLGLGAAPALPGAGPLAAPRAAFVELAVAGVGRGRLGRLGPAGPLGAAVAELAARAVDGDPRVAPLRPEEAAGLSIRLAVLGPLRRLAPPATIVPGVDGLAVARGWHAAVLLPGHAARSGWDGPTCLARVCLAAGLPARAHLDPETVVEAFSAEEFGT